jgi:hypothetical protein
MKHFILFFALFLLPITVSAQSGTAGELTWSLSGGTLTISGEGDMPDYIGTDSTLILSTWIACRDSIRTVIIESGVTSIGEVAFYWCDSLTSVTIPGSVATIGAHAFGYCSGLTSVSIPGSVTGIHRKKIKISFIMFQFYS